MNKLAMLAAAALTVATFGTAAMAQDTVGSFENADSNKDGMVSWDEARGVFPTLAEELYKQADENGDGTLDEFEFASLEGLTAGESDQAASSSSAM